MNKEKTHIIIKGIGWAQGAGTNWCYRYHDVTIISNDFDLLKLQGIYIDTFGSVTNDYKYLRENKNIDLIIDDHLSETKQSIRRMNKLQAGTDLKAIINLIK